jgi:peptidoglycan/LPS O-acetylase OafA/YrhL
MKRFCGVELCRFLCALAVVICHYQFFFAQGRWTVDLIPPADRLLFPLYDILFALYNNGYMAVQIFWVISGFIFFWKYGDAVYQKSVSASKFAVWRLSRLYPLHFVTLIAVALLQPVYQLGHSEPFIGAPNNVSNFLLQLVMASNWFSWSRITFNVPIWSVSAEILAYVAFFLVVRWLRPGIALCAGMVVVTKLIGSSIPAIDCMQFFFMGGLVQRALARLDARYQVPVFWGALGVVAVVILRARWGYAISGTPLLLLAAGIVIAFSLLDTIIKRDMTGLSRLGDLTYASYLIHFPLQLVLVIGVDALGFGRAVFLSPIALASFVVGTFLLSTLVYHHFERPAQDMVRRVWLARTGRVATARTVRELRDANAASFVGSHGSGFDPSPAPRVPIDA